MSSSNGRVSLLECFITRPAHLVQLALPFLNHTGEIFLFFSCGEQYKLIFAKEQRVYFLILRNEDQIISLECSEEEYLVSCLYAYLFCFFLIMSPFTSQCL